MAKIRVFLALENRLLRDVLARVITVPSDLELVGCGVPSAELAEEITTNACDVVVLDVIDLAWLSSQAEIAAKPFKIVAIGIDPGREQFLEPSRYVVISYVLKDGSVSDILAAIRAGFHVAHSHAS